MEKQMLFKPGQVLYTKAGNYAEVVSIADEGEYPLLMEITSGNESNLIQYSIAGEYIIGKKTTMDLDFTLNV
jgi:hypothetical protein